MKRIIIIFILAFGVVSNNLQSQIEHIPVSNPVYNFLIRYETKGFLPHFSSASLPLQKQEIVKALEEINERKNELSEAEIESLNRYLVEFGMVKAENNVLFYSETDSSQILFSPLIGNNEKYIYHYKSNTSEVNLKPLLSLDYRFSNQDFSNNHASIAQGGLRLSGSLTNSVGYFLQATNGTLANGSKIYALKDPKLAQNIKFDVLNSDIDFTESHIRYDKDWFYLIIGRESRLIGAGITQKLISSTMSPASDAISVGAKFSSFEYRFTHYSLLASSINNRVAGVDDSIPAKYIAYHRFSFKPKWGEVSLWENLIYSGRYPDISYLNPLSFFKSLEHANRDRDNAMMGIDFSIRPINNIEIKGTYLLDDIIFDRIGTGYWANKSAWNLGAMTTFKTIDFGLEYSRIEPFTFSHFNVQNNYTNDGKLFGSYLLPNSDAIFGLIQYWWGQRYPLTIAVGYTRHGNNIYYSKDSLLKNVGGDPMIARGNSAIAGENKVTFLDGNLVTYISTNINFAYELFRGFNININYNFSSKNSILQNDFKILFRYEDF